MKKNYQHPTCKIITTRQRPHLLAASQTYQVNDFKNGENEYLGD